MLHGQCHDCSPQEEEVPEKGKEKEAIGIGEQRDSEDRGEGGGPEMGGRGSEWIINLNKLGSQGSKSGRRRMARQQGQNPP